MKALKKIAGDYPHDRLQDNVDNALSPILSKEILNGRLIDNEEFTLGTNLKLQHKLDRDPRGFMVVKHPDGYRADFVTVSSDSKFITLKPQLYTNWASFTATLTNMTADNKTLWYKHSGDGIDIRGIITGNVGVTGNIQITLPNSYLFDTNKQSYDYEVYGIAECFDTGNGGHIGSLKQYTGSTANLGMYGDDGVGWWAAAVPVAWAAGDNLKICGNNIPVTGLTKECSIWVF